LLAPYMMLFDNDDDTALLTALYKTYRTQMLRTAIFVLHSTALAEEAAHEAFLRICKKPRYYRVQSEETRRARILAVTHNTAIDILRRERRYVSLPEHVPTEPHTEPWDRIQHANLLEAVRTMPEIYREVMFRKCVLGLTNRQIANELNLPEGTVASRIKRAKTMLSQYLEKEETTND